LVVINDTRVIAARLKGTKPTGGAVEILLVQPDPQADPDARNGRDVGRHVGVDARTSDVAFAWREDWRVLARNLGAAKSGTRLTFGPDLSADLLARGHAGQATLRFFGRRAANLIELADEVGAVPLPPYIESARRESARRERTSRQACVSPAPTNEFDDRIRYQTIYARSPGAVAAATAGLHFTEDVLAALAAAGHEIVPITLHVGPGTFRPVTSIDPARHSMDSERFEIPAATVAAVARSRAIGRPIVAVGTTVVRTLESAAVAMAGSAGAPISGSTDLFIRPGFPFRVITDLVTNFHLPRSTLLMLVAAFAGRERVLAAYAEAIALGYRFYSYGDAMLIRQEGGQPA
jgi:S-adenosylmethionine:tRNA ribosyltransferase-isomerase